jgi:hypothetical protein
MSITKRTWQWQWQWRRSRWSPTASGTPDELARASRHHQVGRVITGMLTDDHGEPVRPEPAPNPTPRTANRSTRDDTG